MTTNKWKQAITGIVNVQSMIEKANAAFERMSVVNKRLTICQDALEQIKIKQYRPITGIYVDSNLQGLDEEETQLQLISNSVTCNCCALGSLLLSGTRCKNSVDGNSIEDADNAFIKDYLDDIFDRDNLMLVEVAFERDTYFDENNDIDEPYECDFDTKAEYKDAAKEYNSLPAVKAVAFGERYKDDTKRLVAILENMIKNKGVFKP